MPSAVAQALASEFLSHLKYLKGDFQPISPRNWPREFDLMIQKGRDPKQISAVIKCIDIQQMIYIQSAKKFAAQFDSLELKNQVKLRRFTKTENRIFFLKYKDQLKAEFKNISFNEDELIDVQSNKRISFYLPFREFAQAMAELIGGEVSE